MKKNEKKKASKFTTKLHSKHRAHQSKNMNKLSGGSATYWISDTSRFINE